MKEITLYTEYIQMDQLLKWENLIQTGGQMKAFMESYYIDLNGTECHEKRKKVRPGDKVTIYEREEYPEGKPNRKALVAQWVISEKKDPIETEKEI